MINRIVAQLKPDKNLDELTSLYKVPKSEKGDECPHFQVFAKGIQQMDVLYMPPDPSLEIETAKKQSIGELKESCLHYKIPLKNTRAGRNARREPKGSLLEKIHKTRVELLKDLITYIEKHDIGTQYILVVVDDHTKICDAEPLFYKSSEAVLEGLKLIYKRKILALPKIMECDPGKEFRCVVKTFFEKKHIHMRYGQANRHRQQALVEYKNQILGKILTLSMTAEELESTKEDKLCKLWVKDLPTAIKLINKEIAENTIPLTEALNNGDPFSSNYNKVLLEIGSTVRIMLDYPIDSNNKKLHGKFRSGDRRWTKQIYKIKEILILPGKPPMYLTSNNDLVARTRHQLPPV